ncbi:MAG: DUF262 domain-containing protein [Lachnospiraceae bacterium]|nr:DUF262 domain-containing protein [Lachnospiraceae bacterium]
MRAKESSLKEILESEPHRLEVPFFQRKYVWKEENWDELLDSLDNFSTDKVFWGSIIIKKISQSDPGKTYSKGYIIDGQQRLTTIAILTKAIYDLLSESGKKRAKKHIENDIFFAPIASASFDEHEYEIIIKHSRIDNEEFNYIIKAGIYDDNSTDIAYEMDMSSQIRKCYAYFKMKLKDKKDEELLAINNSLYGDEKVFVNISLDERDINEQVIFDSINRAGQKLFTSDIIKNNLFKQLISAGVSTWDTGKMCDTYWDAIFWPGDEDNVWDQKRQFGNVGKSQLDFLLYCVACIEWPNVDVKKVNEKLEPVFEEQTKNYSVNQLETLIQKIAKIALIYRKYIIDFAEDIDKQDFSEKDNVRRLLLIMEKFKIQMFYLYVLKCLLSNIKVYKNDKLEIECDLTNPELNNAFFKLETFLIRRRICGTGTSTYSGICSNIIKNGIEKLYAGTTPEDVAGENKVILQNIKAVKLDVARMILFCLELTR